MPDVTMGGPGGSVPSAPPSGSPPDRVAKALAFVNRDGCGLEIGPSYSPIAPKRDGFKVQIIDHLTAGELRVKYAGQGADLDRIEDVDFVWHGEPLDQLVGTERAYDWIIASHVIEHIPDPISFLLACERLLRPGGVVSLAVPDKRYCFDHFRPLSTTGALLDAFHQQRTRPTPGNVFDHMASAVNRGGLISWGAGDSQPLAMHHRTEDIQRGWETASQTDNYLDVHVWTFIPQSFRLITADLSMLGIIRLGIRGEFDGGHEFFVSLTPGTPTDPPNRVDVLRALNPEPRRSESEPVRVEESGDNTVASMMEVSNREQALLTAKRRTMTAMRSVVRSVRSRVRT